MRPTPNPPTNPPTPPNPLLNPLTPPGPARPWGAGRSGGLVGGLGAGLTAIPAFFLSRGSRHFPVMAIPAFSLSRRFRLLRRRSAAVRCPLRGFPGTISEARAQHGLRIARGLPSFADYGITDCLCTRRNSEQLRTRTSIVHSAAF